MSDAAGSGGPMTRKELEAKIIALAWQDEDFRQKFLADPKAQFEEKFGMPLPDSLSMTAHAEDANHLHFVIPAKPAAVSGELSDEDLEKFAGGTEELSIELSVHWSVTGFEAIGKAAGGKWNASSW